MYRKLPFSFVFLNPAKQNGILSYPGYNHFHFPIWCPKQLPKWCDSICLFLPSDPTFYLLYPEWSFNTNLTSALRAKLALHNNRSNVGTCGTCLFIHPLYWFGPSTWKTLPLLFFWLKATQSSGFSLNISSSKKIVPESCCTSIRYYCQWFDKHWTSQIVAFFSILSIQYLPL